MLVIMTVLSLSGCGKDTGETSDAKQAAIYYGVSSYALFTEDKAIVDELASFYNTLKVRKTLKKLDLFTAFCVFVGDKRFWIDEFGVIWLDGETTCYVKRSGSMDWDRINEIYLGSKSDLSAEPVGE
jgi:predicted CDP-diglyceride synthetase/phosphatidate cytidylyltransferase